ncbi:hypothetical protein ThidrDRAFT_1614 [Thiorhodococcus drewsii AZ1]|uniref:Lipoprotein n=1 Tax=Thiorhodococcus drewsii AZ1 TaxID=765913 RepID=G2E001_9GAMM|nr:hypothetical protein [Thiorhodococcus drewsii]EGV32040.1 hypothetical protein ThidrDRAFT_1614 [Thiorhodococcus drewsii AZ1]
MHARHPRTTSFHVIAGILLAIAPTLSGCQSDASRKEGQTCNLVPGMTTEQLAECGCFPIKAGGGYSVGLSQKDLDQPVQQISVVNYLCPSKTAGFTKIVEVNGIAKEVFR